jgi:hypothetical protein
MQEQRSREAKKADATLDPTQLATRSNVSHDITLHLFSILGFFSFLFSDELLRDRERRG